jgi:hypothetical protein
VKPILKEVGIRLLILLGLIAFAVVRALLNILSGVCFLKRLRSTGSLRKDGHANEEKHTTSDSPCVRTALL